MTVFFCEDDYRLYLRILAEESKRHGTECSCYCLMPNHVHLLAVPAQEDSLALTFGKTHRRYAWIINQRKGWRGHLWQERFSSCPMSDDHLRNAVHYVLTNPLRAGLVRRPQDWPHSSIGTYLDDWEDPLLPPGSPAAQTRHWEECLSSAEAHFEAIRASTRTGRPLGGDDFVHMVEEATGMDLQKRRPGPKPKP